MNKLLAIGVMMALMVLAPGGGAGAQTMVEYGGLVSHSGVRGAGKHQAGSWKTRHKSSRRSRAKR